VEAGYGGRSAHGRSVILDNIEYSSAKKSVIMHCMLHNCSGVVYIYIYIWAIFGATTHYREEHQCRQNNTIQALIGTSVYTNLIFYTRKIVHNIE
jgi:hypothetical protein